MNDRRESETWAVDADATLQSLLEDPTCPGLLCRILNNIRSWQVRNETTVGRTLKASSLMPHWTAALLALGAVVTVEANGGAEDVDLEALIQRKVEGRIRTLHIPRQGGARWGEAHVARTPSDDPIVSAVAIVRSSDGVVQEARVALTGVSPAPVWLAEAPSALVGQALDEERIREVASRVRSEVQPEGDYLGSEVYRRAMAAVLTRRALEACSRWASVESVQEASHE